MAQLGVREANDKTLPKNLPFREVLKRVDSGAIGRLDSTPRMDRPVNGEHWLPQRLASPHSHFSQSMVHAFPDCFA